MKGLAVLLLALPLWACDQGGPLERAGEEVDEAIEDFRAGGETTGNRIDDAIDEGRDNIEEAVDDISN